MLLAGGHWTNHQRSDRCQTKTEKAAVEVTSALLREEGGTAHTLHDLGFVLEQADLLRLLNVIGLRGCRENGGCGKR